MPPTPIRLLYLLWYEAAFQVATAPLRAARPLLNAVSTVDPADA